MREIDEIRIEGNVLTIFDTKGERHRFKMGVPEQVYDEVRRALAPRQTIEYAQTRPTPAPLRPPYKDMNAKEVQR